MMNQESFLSTAVPKAWPSHPTFADRAVSKGIVKFCNSPKLKFTLLSTVRLGLYRLSSLEEIYRDRTKIHSFRKKTVHQSSE